MANGKLLFGKPSGGIQTLEMTDSATDSTLVLPLTGTVATVEATVDIYNSHIPMSNFASYHLIDGSLSVENIVLTNGFGLYLYTGNTITPPTINLGMDLESQWGDNANETYGYIIEFKSRSAVGGWTKCNSINGRTKYLDSSSTAVEGTDANLFTLSTVAGNTTLNIGTSSRVNTNGVTYMVTVWQLTHRKTSLTLQGKTQIEHYNPTTLETVIKYEGSGLAGHEIYHSLDRELILSSIKNISAVAHFINDVSSFGKIGDYMHLSLTNAVANDSTTFTNKTQNLIAFGTSVYVNTSGNSYILYGQANAYIDESGKLIGNTEVGIYNGTGASGNKIKTRGKPYRVTIKRLDSVESWRIIDNKRNNGSTISYALYPNTSGIEETDWSIYFQEDGIVINDSGSAFNSSGGQYLYIVEYDTNSNGGGSYYPKSTDNANVQINNAIIPLAKGIDSNGVKNEIVVVNETITGVTWEEGKNYPYRTSTGYGKSMHKPRYLKSELVRNYAGEQPEYFDVEKNKWFSCDAGSELVVNGTFSDGTTTGWTAQDGAILSIDNGTLKVLNGTSSAGSAYQLITGLTIGKKYKIKAQDVGGNTNYSAIFLAYNAPTLANAIYPTGGLSGGVLSTLTVDTEFVTQATSVYVVLRNEIATVNLYNNFDNISVFQIEITPTTEIPESRNYMNHIVHAGSQGNPLFVEELPKIKYENLIVQSENRKVINLGTIYNNNRYVVENPFGNEKYMDCDVRVEIFINNKWSGVQWIFESSSFGVATYSNKEGLVIQTGATYLTASSVVIGGGHGTTANASSAPARLIVTYVGVAK